MNPVAPIHAAAVTWSTRTSKDTSMPSHHHPCDHIAVIPIAHCLPATPTCGHLTPSPTLPHTQGINDGMQVLLPSVGHGKVAPFTVLELPLLERHPSFHSYSKDPSKLNNGPESYDLLRLQCLFGRIAGLESRIHVQCPSISTFSTTIVLIVTHRTRSRLLSTAAIALWTTILP